MASIKLVSSTGQESTESFQPCQTAVTTSVRRWMDPGRRWPSATESQVKIALGELKMLIQREYEAAGRRPKQAAPAAGLRLWVLNGSGSFPYLMREHLGGGGEDGKKSASLRVCLDRKPGIQPNSIGLMVSMHGLSGLFGR